MLNYNYFMKDKETEDKEIQDMVKEVLIGDFYRAAKEWLFSVDEHVIPNYDSVTWRLGLE